ncbi:MAG: hypothetical protein MUF84_14960 [Anaerolineae bacterium]|jgi:hypothetical protein|nr:hypothetical protein [Anaerolineae bacterium]
MRLPERLKTALVGIGIAVLMLGWSVCFPVEIRAAPDPWVSAAWSLNASPEPGLTEPAATQALVPICRLGVSAWEKQLTEYGLIPNFGVGWYLDFSSRWVDVPQMLGAEYARMLHVSQVRPDDPADINLPIPCGPDYGYAIWPSLTDAGLGAMVAANPGHLWIVGNEPDRRGVQNDTCPQQYAEAYHDAYYFIKSRDPSAQVAIAGLVEVTPGRLQYLDIVWDTYRRKYGETMPVDVWTFHVYILSETNNGDAHIALGTDPKLAIPFSFTCSDPSSYCYAEHDDIGIFAQQVVLMRTWMKNHGQQNKPLLLTEFGINLPYDYYGTCNSNFCPADGCFCDTNGETFHPTRVADYLRATFAYLRDAKNTSLGNPVDDYRLVQQWAWFSVEWAGAGSASDLVTSYPEGGYSLMESGLAYQAWAGVSVAKQVNLLPVAVTARSEANGDMVSPVTVTLTADVANNGNVALTQPVSVTFYSDAALLNAIGSTTVMQVPGCARRYQQASVQWRDLPAGVHHYWVRVDSGNTVPDELSETDNVMHGVVIANGVRTFLPSVLRSF